MSNIIRQTRPAPTVFIGEKQFDAMAEADAEKKLSGFFPAVSLITTPEGAKLIPIAESEKLIAQLRDDCAAARQEGHDAGYKVGLEKGLDEARKVLSQFEQAIQNAVQQRIDLLNEAKGQILDLVIKVSRKVTFDGLEVDSEATLKMIEGVISQLVDRSRLRIKVHPKHLPLVEQNMDRFLSSSTSIKDLQFEADPRVQVGGCFIETPSGDIDARLTSQFDVIEDALRAGSEDE